MQKDNHLVGCCGISCFACGLYVKNKCEGCTKTHVKKSDKSFFKEKVKTYGVRTPVGRTLANRYFKKIKHLSKEDIFKLSEKLLQGGYNQEATIAIQWVAKLKDKYSVYDFEIFEKWLDKYIDNWGKDDDFCLHVIHPMIELYPTWIENVKSWAYSDNMWLRRASAVSFITTIGEFYATKHSFKDIFEVADRLLLDKEDLVQKGYGWMLKSASVHNQKQVFDYVMRHKEKMPRTALRYAIEKMPPKLKQQAMQK